MQVENTLKQRTWTLKEKVAQLFIVGLENQNTLGELETFYATGLGGLIFFRKDFQHFDDAFEVKHWLEDIQSRFTGGGLTFISVDQEGGQIERLPQWLLPSGVNASCLGLKNDIHLTEQIALETAHRLKWMGINLNFTPVLDLNLEATNPIISQRSFGTDVLKVTQHAQAIFEAHLSAGVLPVAKHFPGHGSGTIDSHLSLPQFNQWTPEELEPYKNLIQKNLPAILVAHGIYPELSQSLGAPQDLPSTQSGYLVNELLRNQLEFRGLIFSDDLKMGATGQMSQDPEELAVKAFEAGIDILVWQTTQPEAQIAYEGLLKRFEQNKLSENRLDEILSKIIQTKHYLNQKPISNYPDPALTPQACHAQSKYWAQKALQVEHHHVPSCLPLNQFSEWALITPDRSQSVHYGPDQGMPNDQSPSAWAKSVGLNPIATTDYPLKYQEVQTELDKLPTWPDKTLDAIIFIAYNSQLCPLQQAYSRKLQMAHPKTKIVLASASNCLDADYLPNSWAHVVLPNYRASGMEVLMNWLCSKPLKL